MATFSQFVACAESVIFMRYHFISNNKTSLGENNDCLPYPVTLPITNSHVRCFFLSATQPRPLGLVTFTTVGTLAVASLCGLSLAQGLKEPLKNLGTRMKRRFSCRPSAKDENSRSVKEKKTRSMAKSQSVKVERRDKTPMSASRR